LIFGDFHVQKGIIIIYVDVQLKDSQSQHKTPKALVTFKSRY